ncbi:hypothetical protein KIW84_023614 [Lathyrus oleraceus]|uniref:Uncharacterized protein n=1 Tax=Pisum sativum TaxID=3888 RepID=A0A9D4YHX4_PEA|nr:hypothetical protein KIW84_023614 [Pisum sativum]
MVKETRNSGRKYRKWIPLGRLISDILVESKLVAKLEEMNFCEDLYTEMDKSFNRRNLKNMLMISYGVDPVDLDWEFVSTRRPKKSETSRQILRSTITEASEKHIREAAEIRIVVEAGKDENVLEVAKDAEVVEVDKATKATNVVEATKATNVAQAAKDVKAAEATQVAEPANIAEIVKESGHTNKEPEREYVDISTHQNH